MYPAMVACTLDVRCGAIEHPVSLLVAKTALPPDGAFFIAVVSVVNATLTTEESCEAHLGLLLPRAGVHSYFIEAGALHTAW
jgi:hypothetical protein